MIRYDSRQDLCNFRIQALTIDHISNACRICSKMAKCCLKSYLIYAQRYFQCWLKLSQPCLLRSRGRAGGRKLTFGSCFDNLTGPLCTKLGIALINHKSIQLFYLNCTDLFQSSPWLIYKRLLNPRKFFTLAPISKNCCQITLLRST